jgi:hypothetical protein
MAVGDMPQITSAAPAFPVLVVGEIADGRSIKEDPTARQTNVASEDPADTETSIASPDEIVFASPPVEDCEMPLATAFEGPELSYIPDHASGQTPRSRSPGHQHRQSLPWTRASSHSRMRRLINQRETTDR